MAKGLCYLKPRIKDPYLSGISNVSELQSTKPLAGEPAILARRYVGALYALAQQDGLIDAVAGDLRALGRIWGDSAEFRFLASHPRLSRAQMVEAGQKVTAACNLNKLTANFVSVVAQNRRLDILPVLIDFYLDKVAEHRGEHKAEVRVAQALSQAQHDALTAALTSIAGGKVHVAVTQDAALLGGLTVKIGSQLVDASVKTKLDQLERRLKGVA